MKIVRYFPDADLRCSHMGLHKYAMKQDVDVRKLTPGEFVIFVNRKRNMLKMFAARNPIAHLRLDEGRIDDRAIQYIPNCFDGARIDYVKAVAKAIREKHSKYFGDVTS